MIIWKTIGVVISNVGSCQKSLWKRKGFKVFKQLLNICCSYLLVPVVLQSKYFVRILGIFLFTCFYAFPKFTHWQVSLQTHIAQKM